VQYHIHLSAGDIGKYVFLPGDPGRVETIARFLDEPRHVATNREYCTWEGLLEGERVAVTSTGIGGPSAAIALQELARVGCHTFVRLGTCGALQPGLGRGDLILASGSVRGGATALAYVPAEFPAVADPDVFAALRAGTRKLGWPLHTGIIHCKDAFFLEEPATLPARAQAQALWETWQRARVVASEMESDTLFVIAYTLGLRAGTLLLALGGLADGEVGELTSPPQELKDRLIRAGIEGMRELILQDRRAAAAEG
jgi:uridine phosphorylase